MSTPDDAVARVLLADVCACPVELRMTWVRAGAVVRRFALSNDLTAADGDAQGTEFLALECDAFHVDCPACGRVYVRGRMPP